MRTDYTAELRALRENLADERLPEDRASIVEQMERLKLLANQAATTERVKADPNNPYFGHLGLSDDDGERKDIFIGRATWIKGTVRIVDWRHAPISQVFYKCREGDSYELDLGDHFLEGDVAVRRTITIRDGQLQRVASDRIAFERRDDDWIDLSAAQPKLVGGAGSALRSDTLSAPSRQIRRDKHLPEIASLLDPAQFDLIAQPESGVIAIQGSAGSGKTTVALHRTAYLAYQDPRRFRPERTLILVYSRALARYISTVLPALGVGHAQVWTYEDWMGQLARRHYPGMPTHRSEDTPSVVSRFKQHGLMLGLLQDAADHFDGLKPGEVFDEATTNRVWLGRAAEKHAPGAFSEQELDEIHLWCSSAHAVRADGEGSNADDKPSLDFEDDALLLRLHQIMRGPLRNKRKKPLRCAHLVIDEAQDLSPIDLAVLLETTDRNAPVTLAGDTAQRITSDNDFQDWAYVLERLGLAHTTISPLHISYRSTAPIMDLARRVLGPLAPENPPEAPRQGPDPRLFTFAEDGELVTFLADALEDLMRAEPDASAAILTRYTYQADALFAALDRAELPRLRRVADQDFAFAPGIEVTDIAQSKGLEFDYVMIVDCDARTFPATDPARHLLHIGITRAAHLCWLFAKGQPSPLLPAALIGDATRP